MTQINLVYDESVQALRSNDPLIANDETVTCTIFNGLTGVIFAEANNMEIVNNELEIDLRIPENLYRLRITRNIEPFEYGEITFQIERLPQDLAYTGVGPMANMIMIQNAETLESEWYINRSLLPLIMEAGALAFFQGPMPLAISSHDLVVALKDLVSAVSPEIAEAMNANAINQMVQYMNSTLEIPSITLPANIPNARDVPGPTTTTAQRLNPEDPTEITVTFPESQISGYPAYEIYIDYTYKTKGSNAPVDGMHTHVVTGFPNDGLPHYIIVLYWGNDFLDKDPAVTRFGPPALVMPPA